MKLDSRSPLGRFNKERPAKARTCHICQAAETFAVVGQEPNRMTESSLDKGICRDREACESRQPALFTMEEVRGMACRAKGTA